MWATRQLCQHTSLMTHNCVRAAHPLSLTHTHVHILYMLSTWNPSFLRQICYHRIPFLAQRCHTHFQANFRDIYILPLECTVYDSRANWQTLSSHKTTNLLERSTTKSLSTYIYCLWLHLSQMKIPVEVPLRLLASFDGRFDHSHRFLSLTQSGLA